MIVGLGFSPAFLGFSVRCVLSISLPLIAKSKYLLFASIHSLSVLSCFFSGVLCSSKQLRLEYCSCFSTAPERSSTYSLREKCPNTDFFFLVRIFPHIDWIRRDTERYLSVFSPNTGNYGPEKTPYLDTFHTVNVLIEKQFLSSYLWFLLSLFLPVCVYQTYWW